MSWQLCFLALYTLTVSYESWMRLYHKWGIPNSWMVYFMENPPQKKWRFAGTPMDWKPIWAWLKILRSQKTADLGHVLSCWRLLAYPASPPFIPTWKQVGNVSLATIGSNSHQNWNMLEYLLRWCITPVTHPIIVVSDSSWYFWWYTPVISSPFLPYGDVLIFVCWFNLKHTLTIFNVI